MRPIPLQTDPESPFPDPALALREPDGLLAFGGDLSPVRLLNAYRTGIFPWYSAGQPILWWSPDPRLVFDTGAVHLPRRLRRDLRRCDWELRADGDFAAVLTACAQTPRRGQSGTWIVPSMQTAYRRLHELGHAHCIEVRRGERLIGGIYGVAVGQAFFGESMFSHESGASSAALAGLCRLLSGWGWPLLDAQVVSPHLLRLGAFELPRQDFLQRLETLVARPGRIGHWGPAFGRLPAAALA